MRKNLFSVLMFVFAVYGLLAAADNTAEGAGRKDRRVKHRETTEETVMPPPSSSTGGSGARTYNAPVFIDNDDGTVTDTANNLMWQQGEDPIKFNWYAASGTYHKTYNTDSISVCRNLSLGGYSGWRLPTMDELKTLIKTGASPAINTTFFPDFPDARTSYYWSSLAYASDPSGALVVWFYDGYIYNLRRSDNCHVRCVRGGQ